MRDRARGRRVAGPPLLSRRLLQASAALSRISSSIGMPGAGAEELVDAYRASASAAEHSRVGDFVRLAASFRRAARRGLRSRTTGISRWAESLDDALRPTPPSQASSSSSSSEHADERGFFARTWCRDEMAAAGLTADLAQCSLSRNHGAERCAACTSSIRRTRRRSSCAVRAARSSTLPLDLRPDSPTRRSLVRRRARPCLAGARCTSPRAARHGFQTLVDDTDVAYMISAPYAPEAAAGVRWDDPTFGDRLAHASERTISEP